MSTSEQSRTGRIIGRVSGIWSELDYAQRRLFEIRTSLPETPPGDRDRSDAFEAERLDYEVRAWDEFEL